MQFPLIYIMEYLSLGGKTVTEKVIEKSKFITLSRHIDGEDEAKEFIAEVKREYPDATHWCYGYVADSGGAFPRFSDDGEPQGTAGKPILDVLLNQKIYEAAIVVVRYFGGIKLGAGGLVRAYSSSAAENISLAKKVRYELCAESIYIFDYPSVDTVTRYLSERGANVLNQEYSNEARFTVAVKKREEEEFNSSLINRLNGRLKIEKKREYFFPFEI